MTQDFEEHALYFQFGLYFQIWEEPVPLAGSTQHPVTLQLNFKWVNILAGSKRPRDLWQHEGHINDLRPSTFEGVGGVCWEKDAGWELKEFVLILYSTRDKLPKVLEHVQSSSKTKPTQVLRRVRSTPEFTQNQGDLFMVEAPYHTAPWDSALAILV